MTLTRDEFAALYEHAWRPVWRYARRRVGDDQRAEDICSEAFQLAWEKLPADHPNPVGWLVRAAGFAINRAAREGERERAALRDHAVVNVADDADPLLRDLDVAWDRLAEVHRVVLQLIIWDEMSAADAAVVLGCSEPAVWKRASRARAALREVWPTASDEPHSGGVEYDVRSASSR
ncbi:RNA polymerase sigma factor [Microbacterium invictum]|uniref:RNA polymerase sigma-70 factor (ECF subfamily) n=1 Tax=Microbacterium invictum TaxID=515415 RepID=A0AA40SNP2_9MICO|nr:sigma-70 family RNA polymerase sigma factor [Microbacterium invictum]MBB4139571.1 RNA polymerase sigma-70 factor (ECF subfamily) [Microbacterium invictum]